MVLRSGWVSSSASTSDPRPKRVPQLAIVTRSSRLDDMAVFTRTEMAPLVLTTTAVADDTRQRRRSLARAVTCSGDDPGTVDEEELTVSQLAARGLPDPYQRADVARDSSGVTCSAELCLTIALRRRRGAPHSDGTRAGADPDALCPCPHRRLRLPVHFVRPETTGHCPFLTDHYARPIVAGWCACGHRSAHDVNKC